MRKKIEEFGKYVVIAGFKGVHIGNVEKFLRKIREESPSNTGVQFFDARYIATWQHIYFAVLNALTVFKNKENISRSVMMESLLFASAQHQIRKATRILGIKPEATKIAVLIVGEDYNVVESTLSLVSKKLDATRDDTVIKMSKKKTADIQKIFGISNLETETVAEEGDLEKAVTKLVIEHMALLAIQH